MMGSNSNHSLQTKNFIGSGKVYKWWNKISKEYVMVTRPEVVKTYNMYMCGVDKLDCMISFDLQNIQ